MDLKPRTRHLDDRVTVTTPLDKPGAYLVTAQMANGNLSRIIVWVSDTAIVKKPMEGQVFYYVADAVSGLPVPEADLDFFGWKVVPVDPVKGTWKVVTTSFKDKANADGQLKVGDTKQSHEYQWVITGRKAKARDNADRFAYLGFTNVWYGRIHDPAYNATRVFTITDRPVYRPLQQVNYKLWVRHAKYDEPDTSDFANKQFTVRVHNPKGEKVYDKSITSDAFGGVAGDFLLPKGATLGVYHPFRLRDATRAAASASRSTRSRSTR